MTKDELIENLQVDLLSTDGLLTYSFGNDCKTASTNKQIATAIVEYLEMNKLIKFESGVESGENGDRFRVEKHN